MGGKEGIVSSSSMVFVAAGTSYLQAKKLFNSALLLKQNEFQDLSIAHIILSLEEFSKSVALAKRWEKQLFVKTTIQNTDISRELYSHTHKLESILGVFAGGKVVNRFFSLKYDFSKYIHNGLFDFFNSNSAICSKKEMAKTLNEFKKRSIYVDFDSHPPQCPKHLFTADNLIHLEKSISSVEEIYSSVDSMLNLLLGPIYTQLISYHNASGDSKDHEFRELTRLIGRFAGAFVYLLKKIYFEVYKVLPTTDQDFKKLLSDKLFEEYVNKLGIESVLKEHQRIVLGDAPLS